MRHRIGATVMTGLGNPSSIMLNNRWTEDESFNVKVKRMLSEAIEIFPLMKKYEGCDFQIENRRISFGIEPAYMYEHLELVYLQENKDRCYQQRGYAHGVYGSDIASSYRFYNDYKYKSKFVRFVDKWHKILFNKKFDDGSL